VSEFRPGFAGVLTRHSRKRPMIRFGLGAMAAFLMTGLAPVAHAGSDATVNIETAPVTSIAAGFSGVNAPQPRDGVEYFDPKFIAAATPLKPGWVRYPGGTVSMAFDWATGHIDTAWMSSLIDSNPPLVDASTANILTVAQQLTQAKGGVLFSDFATFVHTLGASAILCFNSFTDHIAGSATHMAVAANTYGLNVLEWELGNEAYLYPLIPGFQTVSTYATSSNSYYSDITAGAPSAAVGLFPAGLFPGVSGTYTSWNQGLHSYTPQYWNAASNHIYPIVGTLTAQDTIQTLNGILAHASSDYITSYLSPLVGPNTPIFITELNCCSLNTNQFVGSLYNGIFLAEYIARLSIVPNVKGVGVNSLYTDNSNYDGLIQSVDDHENYLLSQVAANPNYSTNTAINPNTQFQFYTSAPGLAIELANMAINSGTQALPTTVTGGSTVEIMGFGGAPIPAIYAQAYLADSGRRYLLITNKSAAAQSVEIEVNGAEVPDTLTLTYITNASALAANTAQSPVNVRIQATTSSNPINLAAYSVTAVTW
jgi:hypothetical protein